MMKPQRATSIRRHPQIRPMFAGLRHYDRKPASLEVVIVDEQGWEIPFESLNVSESGVFVASALLYEVGQVHELVLRTSDRRFEVRLSGEVVRVERQRSKRAFEGAGMAYRFLPTDQQTFQGLAQLVAAL